MFAPGDVVTARGQRWVVEESTVFVDCTLLKLAAARGVDRHTAPRECRLLHPFDRPIASQTTPRIRAVSRRRWLRHLQAELASLRAFGQLSAAQAARMEILPFQLEPALAMIQGRASRFLLADEVGLGKTIQAGLMLAELQRRGWCERALILSPAGLRHQWADELERRFDIRAAVVDAPTLRIVSATLPFDVNPWLVESVAIASIDFVKQPEVLRAVTSQLWDMVIVDEAHQVASAPLRAAAVKALAERARHIALLTATPHAGDEIAYRALCALGRLDREEPILLFRRTREQVGLTRARRVHLLPVRLTKEALEMHRLLGDYIRRLWQIAGDSGRNEIRLVAIVLGKRAYSSPASLLISVQRRLEALSGHLQPSLQSDLPFDAEDDPADVAPSLAADAFERSDRETEVLRAILSAAERACADDRKIAALVRLLRRVPEPVVVFTEYRDTLMTLASAFTRFRRTAILHGGLTAGERLAAVDAFTKGDVDLLLATDAGSEGLNLQSRCRLVVNLELPWNPIRLEQRIGRVDRLGQPRTVHAINLFAEETAESTVLAGLLGRLHRIRCSEIEVASCVISNTELKISDTEPGLERCTVRVGLQKESEAEAARLRTTKAPTAQTASIEEERIPVTTVRLTASTRAAAGLPTHHREPSIIWFVRAGIVNGAGRLADDMLFPVWMPLHVGPHAKRRRDVRALAEQIVQQHGATVMGLVRQRAAERSRDIQSQTAEWVMRTLRRERELSKIAAADAAALIQAGLFDTRALKQHEDAERQRRVIAEESKERAATLEAAATSSPQPPEIALLLISC
jgi:superfamily II DNA/RNA helicase